MVKFEMLFILGLSQASDYSWSHYSISIIGGIVLIKSEVMFKY